MKFNTKYINYQRLAYTVTLRIYLRETRKVYYSWSCHNYWLL